MLNPYENILRSGNYPHYLMGKFSLMGKCSAPEHRGAVFMLLALDQELLKIKQTVSEPMLGLIRYQWWRDALQNMCRGKPVAAHEIASPLNAWVRQCSPDEQWFNQVLDGYSAWVEHAGYAVPVHAMVAGDVGLFRLIDHALGHEQSATEAMIVDGYSHLRWHAHEIVSAEAMGAGVGADIVWLSVQVMEDMANVTMSDLAPHYRCLLKLTRFIAFWYGKKAKRCLPPQWRVAWAML